MASERIFDLQKLAQQPFAIDRTSPNSFADADAGRIEPEEPPSAPFLLDAFEEWRLARRIAASSGFQKSKHLREFLLFVCKLYLQGKTGEITEQRIGIGIFGRPTGYDPGNDNIVRSYARLLRTRLDDYFAREGAEEQVRITIPRGAYIPVFEPRPGVKKPVASDTAGQAGIWKTQTLWQTGPTAARSEGGEYLRGAKPRFRFDRLSGLLGVAAGLLLAFAAWSARTALHNQSHISDAHALWSQLFQPNRNTMIVVADSGLGILQNISRNLVDIHEYADHSFLSRLYPVSGLNAGNFNDLSRQRYTSIVALDVAVAIEKLPEFLPSRTQIKFARGITADDIRSSNTILIGSKHTNPWVELFEPRMNFRLEFTPQVDDSYIENEHPQPGEQKIYRNGSGDNNNVTYGTVDYLSGVDGVGHVLILQGLNMAATQAAADVLLNSSETIGILKQARRANGTLRPFELLVETRSIGAAAPTAHILAKRIYD